MQYGSEQLVAWIERSRLTQSEAGEQLGLHRSTLNKILNGKRRPGRENAILIQRVAGIPVEAWSPTVVGKRRKRASAQSQTVQ